MWIGAADINGNGDTDRIFINRQIGHLATVGTPQPGLVCFSAYGWTRETPVVGICTHPLAASGAMAISAAPTT